MSEIIAKKLKCSIGILSYYRTVKIKQDYDILFIHGLGGSKKWFKNHFERYNLGEFSWIVPDLFGYGESSKPSEIEAYSMNNQASTLSNLLVAENVESLVILAHSMGGPIAVSLVEQLIQHTDVKINVLDLIYMEGNLDINDAFFSSKIAKYSLKEFKESFETWLGDLNEKADDELRKFLNELRRIGPMPLWASSIDLVSISESNQLLPRLRSVSQAQNCSLHFVFGEKNKGLFTSQKLVEKSQLPLIYVPEAGHTMHQDNPNAFWNIIKQLLP